jgi:hypothetical protein
VTGLLNALDILTVQGIKKKPKADPAAKTDL